MRYLSCIIVLFLTSGLYSQNLDEYLVVAAESNPGLKASFLSYQAALEEVNQVGTLPDPEVSFGYFISPVETRVGPQQARIQISQMFPWFGTLELREQVKTSVARAEYENFEQARKDLYFKVESSYYECWALSEVLKIQQANLELLKSLESLALVRYETGSSSLVDVLRIQMDILRAESEIQKVQDDFVQKLAFFNLYLNRDVHEAVEFRSTLIPGAINLSKEQILDSIQNTSHLLARFEHLKTASHQRVELALKQNSPKLGAGISYIAISERSDMQVENNGRDALMPMVSMKIPIYRKKNSSLVKQNTFDVQIIEQKELQSRNDLESLFESQWFQYNDAKRIIKLNSDQLSIATQTRDILIDSYGSNDSQFEEILRLQALILQLEIANTEAIKQNNTAISRIKSIM
jgi:cobalt-zinc-cadmium efflux system outer membrane protein